MALTQVASGLIASVSASTLTGTLPVANGGTGAATLTANNVLLGNGTSALQAVAPGSSGNLLTSNGTTWVSSTPAGGGVTSLNGATGAVVTTTAFALGGYVTGRPQNTSNYNVNDTVAGSSLTTIGPGLIWNSENWYWTGQGTISSGSPANVGVGSWRCVSPCVTGPGYLWALGLWVRYA